jgi:hypothetical protein
MRRCARSFLAVVILGTVLSAPSVAFAPPMPPPPAAGTVVRIWADAVSSPAHVYQDALGTWWIDGSAGNYSSNLYDPGVALQSCVVTVEYLNASDAVVGTGIFPVLAYTLDYSDPPGYAHGYYSYYHAKLALPPGADPTKTRIAADSASTNYGVAAPSEAPLRLSVSPGTPTSDASGRTTYNVRFWNTSGTTCRRS